jgi:hypothetical protein
VAVSLRTGLRVLAAVVSLLALVSLRVVLAGEAAIARGTEALEAADVGRAIAESEAAASWYAPGAPHVRVAYARLSAIADEAERRRQRTVALSAHRAVIAASEQTRWLVAPHAGDAQRSREAVARIEATGPRSDSQASEPAQTIEAEQLRSMARELGPRRGFALLFVASFVCVLAGVALLLWRALDETGRVDGARSRVPVALAALGLAGYVASLLLA